MRESSEIAALQQWTRLYGPVLIALTAVVVGQNLLGMLRDGAPDYVIFYESARAWTAGYDPYVVPYALDAGANLNSPGLVALTAVLATIPYWWSVTASLCLSAAGWAWCARAVASTTGLPLALIAVATLGHQGGGVALRLGEVTFLLMPLFVLAWQADRRGHTARAGALMGALIYLKVFLGLYGVYWLWRRSWAALSACAATLVGLWVTTWATLGTDVIQSWLTELRMVSWQAHALNGSIQAFATRLFEQVSTGGRPAPTFTPFVVSPVLETAGAAALVLLLAAVALRALPRLSRDGQWTLCFVTALLFSPLGWIYYLPWIAGPALLSVHRRALVVALACLSVPWGVLVDVDLGAFGTATLGSVATWSLLALYAGVVAPAMQQARVAAQAVDSEVTEDENGRTEAIY